MSQAEHEGELRNAQEAIVTHQWNRQRREEVQHDIGIVKSLFRRRHLQRQAKVCQQASLKQKNLQRLAQRKHNHHLNHNCQQLLQRLQHPLVHLLQLFQNQSKNFQHQQH